MSKGHLWNKYDVSLKCSSIKLKLAKYIKSKSWFKGRNVLLSNIWPNKPLYQFTKGKTDNFSDPCVHEFATNLLKMSYVFIHYIYLLIYFSIIWTNYMFCPWSVFTTRIRIVIWAFFFLFFIWLELIWYVIYCFNLFFNRANVPLLGI